MPGDAGAEVVDGGFELRFGDQAIDDTEVEGAFGGDRFTEEHKFEGDFGADEKRKNGGRERRKDTDGDFRLSEARFRRGDDQIAECGEFRASADGRAVDDAENRLGCFEDAGENGVKRVEHLENALGSIFADVNAAAEYLAGGIEDDELHVGAFARVGDAVDKFAQEAFVEEIVLGAVEGHASDAGVELKFHELKIGGIPADGFGANLDVAIGKSGAADFHRGFSFANGYKTDVSTRESGRLESVAAWCAMSLLAERTGVGAGGLTRGAKKRETGDLRFHRDFGC